MKLVHETVEVLNEYFENYDNGSCIAYVSVCGNAVDIHDQDGRHLVTYEADEADSFYRTSMSQP